MNKIVIRTALFVLITGMFLVVSGCGYRCQSWAYRTAYRQVCKSYSSNGHCSFWGSESYQERYCTRWIKDPQIRKKELERQNQKLKSLSQKEQKQRRGTIKNQVKITTQGLTASELNDKALALWKDGKYTDPDRVIAYLSRAIRLDSKYIYTYYNRGLAWYDKGNYDRAISDYDKAIELNPRYANAYNNRGLAWAHKGNYDRAISDYNKAIELNPKQALTYNSRGLAWADKGNYDRAISDYNKTIKLNPRYAKAYNNRGSAWFNKGNYDRSCRDYQKACELGRCMGLNWARKKGYCK